MAPSSIIVVQQVLIWPDFFSSPHLFRSTAMVNASPPGADSGRSSASVFVSSNSRKGSVHDAKSPDRDGAPPRAKSKSAPTPPRCKTKIVCTIGPTTASPEMLEKLADAGMVSSQSPPRRNRISVHCVCIYIYIILSVASSYPRPLLFSLFSRFVGHAECGSAQHESW